MRTILGFLPAVLCAGAMIVCVRMMRHAHTERPEAPAVETRNAEETEARDG